MQPGLGTKPLTLWFIDSYSWPSSNCSTEQIYISCDTDRIDANRPAAVCCQHGAELSDADECHLIFLTPSLSKRCLAAWSCSSLPVITMLWNNQTSRSHLTSTPSQTEHGQGVCRMHGGGAILPDRGVGLAVSFILSGFLQSAHVELWTAAHQHLHLFRS